MPVLNRTADSDVNVGKRQWFVPGGGEKHEKRLKIGWKKVKKGEAGKVFWTIDHTIRAISAGISGSQIKQLYGSLDILKDILKDISESSLKDVQNGYLAGIFSGMSRNIRHSSTSTSRAFQLSLFLDQPYMCLIS